MKVCLIFPNIFAASFLNSSIPHHPPLSLAYLGATARAHGHNPMLIDAAAEKLDDKKLIKKIRNFSPDVIGISTNISCANAAIRTANLIKKAFCEVPLLFGGPWATIEYEEILSKNLADVVILGEGEETLVELLGILKQRGKWSKVKGIAFKNTSTGDVVLTDRRPFISDLDSIPFPAWDLLPQSKKYSFVHRKAPFYPIITTRGCPFDCIHCTKVVHGYKYRKRSIENVIAEITYLKNNFNVKEIFIIDDNFNFDLPRAEKILLEIIKNDFSILIKFTNGIRADMITEKFGRILRAAGAYAASLGIESGNQEIVNKIGKKLDLSKVREAVRILRDNKFIIGGFFILGHPYDSFETMVQTITFAKDLDLDYPQFFKSIPFPGTKMYTMVKEHGRFLDDSTTHETSKKLSSSGDNYYLNKQANFEIWKLKPQDIEKAFKLSYSLFYLRPWKIIRLVTQYRSFTELAWLISTAIKMALNALI